MEIKDSARKVFKEIIENTVIKNNDSTEVNNAKIKSFCEQVHNIRPKTLFRYREYNDYTVDALSKFLITSSKPAVFNDPFDSLVYVDTNLIASSVKIPGNRQNYKSWAGSNKAILNLFSKDSIKMSEEFLDETPEKYQSFATIAQPELERRLNILTSYCQQELKNSTHIACFSEDVLSPTMWAHYADSHKGFVIEYNFSEYTRYKCENSDNFGKEYNDILFPVIYSDKRYNASNYLRTYVANKFRESGIPISYIDDDLLSKYKTLLYKSKDWEYEKEWRIITMSNIMPNIIKKPIGIYWGANMEPKKRQVLYNIAQKEKINLYEMLVEHNNYEYRMNYRNILSFEHDLNSD